MYPTMSLFGFQVFSVSRFFAYNCKLVDHPIKPGFTWYSITLPEVQYFSRIKSIFSLFFRQISFTNLLFAKAFCSWVHFSRSSLADGVFIAPHKHKDFVTFSFDRSFCSASFKETPSSKFASRIFALERDKTQLDFNGSTAAKKAVGKKWLLLSSRSPYWAFGSATSPFLYYILTKSSPFVYHTPYEFD